MCTRPLDMQAQEVGRLTKCGFSDSLAVDVQVMVIRNHECWAGSLAADGFSNTNHTTNAALFLASRQLFTEIGNRLLPRQIRGANRAWVTLSSRLIEWR